MASRTAHTDHSQRGAGPASSRTGGSGGGSWWRSGLAAVSWWTGWTLTFLGFLARGMLIVLRVAAARRFGRPCTESDLAILRAMAAQQAEQADWCMGQADIDRRAVGAEGNSRSRDGWHAANAQLFTRWGTWHGRRRRRLGELRRCNVEAEQDLDALRMSWEYLVMDLRHRLGPGS